MNVDPALLGFLGVVATAVLGVVAAWVTARSQKRTSESQSVGVQWNDLTGRIMTRLDAQQDEIDDLKSEINRLKAELNEIRDRYWAAIQVIRKIFLAYPEVRHSTELPAGIAEDI